MAQCTRCGAEIQPNMSFCSRCGASVAVKSASKAMPQRPQPLVANVASTSRPVATPEPVKVTPVAPAMAMPARPQAPQMQPTTENKGWFTDAVRATANVITGGQLNRDIENEQRRAVAQQANQDRQEIQDAQEAEQAAINAQVRAERDAERQRDLRNSEAIDGVDVVRGRAIWNIQPGEIARRISESELEEVEKLKGIIVQEGVTAIIFANGQLVSTLSSGAYLFYKSVEEEKAAIRRAVEEAEKELEEKKKKDPKKPTFRELGIVGSIGRAASWVGRIIFGEKKNEQKARSEKRKLDYARILANATQAPVLSVYLVSDRYITLTFGGEINEQGALAFKPYTIPVGIHNVEVGVSLQLQINDIHAFATNYLADRKSVTTTFIQQTLNSSIEAMLRQTLRNTTYEQTGFSDQIITSLKFQIKQTINQQLYGIVCTQVLQITDNNQEFERFRSVERELYNTEKELDFMKRTGEFRNRMENLSNAQEIQSAQNAEELRYALSLINKDKLLHDDELEEFVLLLESQKRIREATTQEQEFEALEDLRKNRLVKEDEMEALEDALQHNKIPRNEITQIMRIESQQKIDAARQMAEWALDDAASDHDWERADLERRRNWGIEDEELEREWLRNEREYNRDFERKAKEDDYDFQQLMRRRELEKEDRLQARAEKLEDEQLAYERQRQDKLDDLEELKVLAQIQANQDAQKFQHETDLATLNANERMNRDNLFANMPAEQIRAAQLDRLSESGQVAMANAYSGEKEAAFLREQAAREREMAQQDKQNMMDFAKEMAAMVRDTASNVSGAQQYAQQQQINHLQNENRYQQQRNAHLQDTAMHSMSQVSAAAAGNINAFNGGLGGQKTVEQSAPVEQLYSCPNCSGQIAYGVAQCPHCGTPFQW